MSSLQPSSWKSLEAITVAAGLLVSKGNQSTKVYEFSFSFSLCWIYQKKTSQKSLREFRQFSILDWRALVD